MASNLENENKPRGASGPLALMSFLLVPNENFAGDQLVKISQMIVESGGDKRQIKIYDKNDLYPAHQRLMVVSEHIDFPEYHYYRSLMVPVVQPAFIEETNRLKRPTPHQSYSPDPANVLKDLFISCSGLSDGDTQHLYQAVKAFGGQGSNTLTSYTTHVVALDNDQEKCAIANKHNIKVVLPAWINHCVRLGQLLDETPYLFPNPPYLLRDSPLPSLESNADLQTYLEDEFGMDIKKPVRQLDIFDGRRFFVDKDVIEEENEVVASYLLFARMIESQGGKITDNIEHADVYIGQYRSGDNYKRASARGIDVGTMLWVYWMVENETWESPLQNLLHYPIPREPLPGFENFQIAITNFVGDSRTYMERLIVATGAKYTKTLRQDNTHLITTMACGQKYEVAKKWNVHVVNASWLEESYVKWEEQSVSSPSYTELPDRADKTDTLHKALLDIKLLKRFYEDPDSDIEPVIPSSQPDEALHLSQSQGNSPEVEQELQSRNRKDSAEVEQELQNRNRKDTPEKIQEDITPSRHPSRSAKSKATETLRGIGAKETEYRKQVTKFGRKHQLPPLEDESQFVDAPSVKKSRLTPPASSTPDQARQNEDNDTKILFITTGVDDKIKAYLAKHKKTLEQFDIYQVKTVEAANYLVATTPMRTANFLRGLAKVKDVLLPKYFEDCISSQQKLDITPDYMLKTASRDLAQALSSPLRGNIFDGLVFNFLDDSSLTPFHEIVKDHGGDFHVVKQPKRGSKASISQYVEGRDGHTILIVPSDKQTKHVLSFKQTVPGGLAFVKDLIVKSVQTSDCNLEDETHQVR